MWNEYPEMGPEMRAYSDAYMAKYRGFLKPLSLEQRAAHAMHIVNECRESLESLLENPDAPVPWSPPPDDPANDRPMGRLWHE